MLGTLPGQAWRPVDPGIKHAKPICLGQGLFSLCNHTRPDGQLDGSLRVDYADALYLQLFLTLEPGRVASSVDMLFPTPDWLTTTMMSYY